MGISYIPGPEATLGPALAELVKGIGTAVNPNAEFRKKFEQALATNPSMVQQLADLEFKSPGSVTEAFKDYISPQTRDAILGAKPSVRAQGEAAVGGAIPSVSGLTADQLPAAPTLAQIGATRELTGVRPEELGQEGAAGTMRRAAMEYVGSLSPADRARLGAYATFPTIMNDEHFAQQLKLQRDIFESRHADRINEWRLQKRTANAAWWQQKTGVGTIDTWDSYFYEPTAQARLEKLQGGQITSPTREDMQLLQVDEAAKAAPAEWRLLNLNRTRLGIQQAYKGIKDSETDSERLAKIADLNQLLSERAKFGGPQVHAEWAPSEESKTLAKGKEPLGSALGAVLSRYKKLRFFDAAGNEIDEASALSPPEAPQPRVQNPAPPTAQPAPVDTTHSLESARKRAAELQAMGLTREAVIAKLKAEGYNIK